MVELQVSDDEIIKRMSGRLIHPASGRVYNRYYHPPKVPNTDDVTGEHLVQREDDQESTVRKRLAVYHEQTQPLLSYFRAGSYVVDGQVPVYLIVEASRSPEQVNAEIIESISKHSFSDKDFGV